MTKQEDNTEAKKEKLRLYRIKYWEWLREKADWLKNHGTNPEHIRRYESKTPYSENDWRIKSSIKEIEMFEEYKDKYIGLIKDKCVNCDSVLPKTWKYYLSRGNYCIKCNANFQKRANARSKERNANRYKLLKELKAGKPSKELLKYFKLTEDKIKKMKKQDLVSYLAEYVVIDF